MIHPATELRLVSPQVGYGVFATEFLPRGTLTWVLDNLDQRFTPARLGELDRPYAGLLQRYGFQDRAGDTVLCWDLGRYVNHSCEPNSISAGADEFEVAVRDIEPGEQITDDYSEFSKFEPFRCLCGARRCVGTVIRTTLRQRMAQRRVVTAALALAAHVPQPLGDLGSRHAVLARWLSVPQES